jgi:hypothetical protein
MLGRLFQNLSCYCTMEAALLSVPYQEAVSTFRTRQKMVCWMVARAGGAEKVR